METTTQQPQQQQPQTVQNGNADTKTFGVEIECYIPTAILREQRIDVGTYYNGADVPERYNLPGWKLKSDSSVSAPFGCSGVELVSPVLSGRDGLEQLTRAAHFLRDVMHATTDRNCGVHVHVGFDVNQPNGLKKLRQLCFLVANVETGLYGTNGSAWRRNSYYATSTKIACEQLQNLPKNPTAADFKSNPGFRRNSTLNITGLFSDSRYRKPTVEFRLFSGTVQPLKLQLFVQLCVGLVCKNDKLNRCPKWESDVSARSRGIKTDTGRMGCTTHVAACYAGFSGIGHIESDRLLNRVLNWGKSGDQFGLMLPENLKLYRAESTRLAQKFDSDQCDENTRGGMTYA